MSHDSVVVQRQIFAGQLRSTKNQQSRSLSQTRSRHFAADRILSLRGGDWRREKVAVSARRQTRRKDPTDHRSRQCLKATPIRSSASKSETATVWVKHILKEQQETRPAPDGSVCSLASKTFDRQGCWTGTLRGQLVLFEASGEFVGPWRIGNLCGPLGVQVATRQMADTWPRGRTPWQEIVARLLFRKWDTVGREFTGSVLEQRADVFHCPCPVRVCKSHQASHGETTTLIVVQAISDTLDRCGGQTGVFTVRDSLLIPN